ncbi:MAG: T9SS type A sorting domain-containing protein [Candidatus Paceibacterota bacterium]
MKKIYSFAKSLTMKTLILVVFLLSVLTSQAQPNIEWKKCFGGTNDEKAYSVQQTTDGGYIVAGYSRSSDCNVSLNKGMSDYWIVKLSSSGNIEWQKTYGGSSEEEALCVKQTMDGGYVVVGFTCSNNGDVISTQGGSDYWILKLDASGNILWQKTYGGVENDRAYSVEQTTDGGYIVAGISYSSYGDVMGNYGMSDCWILKLDASGNILWQKILGGTNIDAAFFIKKATDGGYLVGCSSFSNDVYLLENQGYFDYWIVKLDSSGNIEWDRSLGGPDVEEIESIDQTTDGGYIIGGFSSSTSGEVIGNHGLFDYWIVKLDSNIDIEWQKCLGGTENDMAYSIQQTVDDGYIVVGHSSSSDGDLLFNHGLSDDWIVKLSSNGDIEWQKILGGTYTEEAYSAEQTTDGGYIIAGGSSSNDGDVAGNYGFFDFWIIKLSPIMSVEEKNKPAENVVVYPTIFDNQIKVVSENKNIEVSLFNCIGNLIQETTGFNSITINTTDLPSGLYFTKTTLSDGYVKVHKIVKK